jgi:hypothetical protein
VTRFKVREGRPKNRFLAGRRNIYTAPLPPLKKKIHMVFENRAVFYSPGIWKPFLWSKGVNTMI